jgi:hypothetical protein
LYERISVKVINGIYDKNRPTPTRSAAMYYKTEPLVSGIGYHHTNNWEIVRAIQILNSLGYVVDLIDRTNHNWVPKKKYDIFLGLGVGNSGRNFTRYANLSGASKKILLAMGPQPDTSNKLTLKRYDMFRERTGKTAPPMRTVEQVTGDNFLKIVEAADCIFNIGEKNTNSFKSYEEYGLPIFNFYPAISPKVTFNNSWLKSRDRNTFLCFAGNGFICKGVDLVVEAFLKDPTKQLHICGPSSEQAFFNHYNTSIANSSNIKYHGFIEPGGERFQKLASICSYTVFHSAAESCCTAVATTMRAGIVPIINSWTGICVDDCGLLMSDKGDLISNITSKTNEAVGITKEKYKLMVQNTLKKAELFSQQSFTDSYLNALKSFLEGDKK